MKEATVTAASPKAISTGQHYDVFLADDLVHQNNYRNIDLLDKLMADFDLFMPLLDPGAYTYMTGTRYHHADIYGRVIRRNQGEWQVSIKSASLTGKWPIHDENELLFPVHEVSNRQRKIGFTKALLEQLARDNPETFWAQYMNQIVAAGRQPFPEHLILDSVRNSSHEHFPAASPTIFMVDLAESKRADADHSVVVAGRQRGNSVWITDCIGSTFSAPELANVLLAMSLKHRPAAILLPKEPGTATFAEYAKVIGREKGIDLPIRILDKSPRHKDAKAIRIGALESRFRNKQLFLLAGIPDFKRLLEEFTQFPKGAHDDRPDAIAMLVEFFAQGFSPLHKSTLPFVVTGEINGLPFEDLPASEDSPVMGEGFVC